MSSVVGCWRLPTPLNGLIVVMKIVELARAGGLDPERQFIGVLADLAAPPPGAAATLRNTRPRAAAARADGEIVLAEEAPIGAGELRGAAESTAVAPINSTTARRSVSGRPHTNLDWPKDIACRRSGRRKHHRHQCYLFPRFSVWRRRVRASTRRRWCNPASM
jgi:hypothetical protein